MSTFVASYLCQLLRERSNSHRSRRFLIVGALCSVWGIVLFFILPDSPPTTRTFTRGERLLAVGRLRENQTGVDNKKFKWDQFRETFYDPKTWLFFLLGLVGNIPNGGISNVIAPLASLVLTLYQ